MSSVPSRFWWFVAIYGTINLFVGFYCATSYQSDSQHYLNLAIKTVQEGGLFPFQSAIYGLYIAAPLHINIEALVWKIWPSINAIILLNIVYNLIQLVLIYGLTNRFFGNAAAWVSAAIYALYFNNLGLVTLNLTELSFGVFMLASLWFFTAKENSKNIFLAGIMAGLALGIRPTMLPLIGLYLLYLAWYFIKTKNPKFVSYFLVLILGIMVYVLPMGLYSKKHTGYFLYTSTTGPANMIMSAFDGANGVYTDVLFKSDTVLLSNKPFTEKNAYLTAKSLNWIQKNPIKWLSFWPRKLSATFSTDDIAVHRLLNTDWFIGKYFSDKKKEKRFNQEPISFKIAWWTLQIFNQLFYLMLMCCWLYQFYDYCKNFKTKPAIYFFLNAFFILGILLTFIGSVGNPRYKYSYLVASFIIISPVIITLYRKFRFGSKLFRQKRVLL